MFLVVSLQVLGCENKAKDRHKERAVCVVVSWDPCCLLESQICKSEINGILGHQSRVQVVMFQRYANRVFIDL